MSGFRDKVVSGGAMPAQRDLSAQVISSGGEYLWTVKKNQPRLYGDIATCFASPPPGVLKARQMLFPGARPLDHRKRLHNRRDETLREDCRHLRLGRAQRTMAAINNLVLALLLR